MLTPNPASDQQKALPKLLVGSVCISFSPVFIKLAAIPPDSAGFYRMLFAGVSLWLLMLIRREGLKMPAKPRLQLCLAGLFLSIDFMFWHRSIELIGPGLSTLLGNFQVFFTAFLSWLIFKQRITGKFMVAVAIAVCGLAMVTGIDFAGLEYDYKLGIVYGFLTAVFYSGYILLVKSAMNDDSVSGVPAMLMVAIPSTLFLAVIAPANSQSLSLPGINSLFALIGVGVVSTTIGWSLISTAIKYTQATIASLVLLLQPALAMVWDTLFFSRPTGFVEIIGVLLILSGIYIGSRIR